MEEKEFDPVFHKDSENITKQTSTGNRGFINRLKKITSPSTLTRRWSITEISFRNQKTQREKKMDNLASSGAIEPFFVTTVIGEDVYCVFVPSQQLPISYILKESLRIRRFSDMINPSEVLEQYIVYGSTPFIQCPQKEKSVEEREKIEQKEQKACLDSVNSDHVIVKQNLEWINPFDTYSEELPEKESLEEVQEQKNPQLKVDKEEQETSENSRKLLDREMSIPLNPRQALRRVQREDPGVLGLRVIKPKREDLIMNYPISSLVNGCVIQGVGYTRSSENHARKLHKPQKNKLKLSPQPPKVEHSATRSPRSILMKSRSKPSVHDNYILDIGSWDPFQENLINENIQGKSGIINNDQNQTIESVNSTQSCQSFENNTQSIDEVQDLGEQESKSLDQTIHQDALPSPLTPHAPLHSRPPHLKKENFDQSILTFAGHLSCFDLISSLHDQAEAVQEGTRESINTVQAFLQSTYYRWEEIISLVHQYSHFQSDSVASNLSDCAHPTPHLFLPTQSTSQDSQQITPLSDSTPKDENFYHMCQPYRFVHQDAKLQSRNTLVVRCVLSFLPRIVMSAPLLDNPDDWPSLIQEAMIIHNRQDAEAEIRMAAILRQYGVNLSNPRESTTRLVITGSRVVLISVHPQSRILFSWHFREWKGGEVDQDLPQKLTLRFYVNLEMRDKKEKPHSVLPTDGFMLLTVLTDRPAREILNIINQASMNLSYAADTVRQTWQRQLREFSYSPETNPCLSRGSTAQSEFAPSTALHMFYIQRQSDPSGFLPGQLAMMITPSCLVLLDAWTCDVVQVWTAAMLVWWKAKNGIVSFTIRDWRVDGSTYVFHTQQPDCMWACLAGTLGNWFHNAGTAVQDKTSQQDAESLLQFRSKLLFGLMPGTSREIVKNESNLPQSQQDVVFAAMFGHLSKHRRISSPNLHKSQQSLIGEHWIDREEQLFTFDNEISPGDFLFYFILFICYYILSHISSFFKKKKNQ